MKTAHYKTGIIAKTSCSYLFSYAILYDTFYNILFKQERFVMKLREDIAQIIAAQEDSQAEDRLIRKYLPFIKSETAHFIHRIPREGVDDELSIAMFAFHEAVLSFHKDRGSFITWASTAIKSRLIDYYRKEQRHNNTISLDQDNDDSENSKTLMEQLDNGCDEIDDRYSREATREEIMEFASQLTTFDLKLTDIAENCPKQDRTLAACHKCLAYAKTHPELLDQLLLTHKLPLTALSNGSGVERKTLERHRKYLVAILLAYTNGFEIIRGHLRQIAPTKTGRENI